MNADQRIPEVKLLGQYALNLFYLLHRLHPSLPCWARGGRSLRGWHQQAPLMLEWRQEKGRAEEWDWCRYSPCFPCGSSLRRPVWPQATAPGSQPSTDHSNCSLLLQQAYLAHATDPLVLHASFRLPNSLTIALQMCPLLESLQTLSVCSYWASKALGCCSREERMLYCMRTDVRVTFSVLIINQKRPLPAQKAQTWQSSHCQGKGRWTSVAYSQSTETVRDWGSLTGSPGEKGKLLPGKKEGFAVST